MIRKLVEIENTQRESLKHMSLYKILRNNLIFLFNYRFFFRDILEIINLVPNAKSVYKDVIIINEKFTDGPSFPAPVTNSIFSIPTYITQHNSSSHSDLKNQKKKQHR